jgi:hypothetical protein
MRLLRSMRRRLLGKSLTCPVPEEKTLPFPFLSSLPRPPDRNSPLSIPSHPIPSPPSLPPHLILPSPLCVYSTFTIQFNSVQFNSIQFIQSPSFILHKFAVKYGPPPIPLHRVLWCSLAVLIYPVHHSSDKLSGSPSVRFVSCPATSPRLI